jgi:NDP-hexose-3-ketoreductase
VIRVGVLGCSDIARRKFIPALLKSAQACLAAVASRQPGKAAFCFPPAMSVVTLTYQELVCSPIVDLVYISLPNHLHEELSIRALKQGKHVICEKPLGLSAASVKRMLDVADTHGRLLFENLMYLQHPQHKAVKALIDSGRVGKIISLRSEFAFPGPVDGDFRLDPRKGGGAFHDMNRYPLSAALYFLTGKEHRFCQGSKVVREGLNLSLQADSCTDAGETFSFLTSFHLPYRSFYRITTDRGCIAVERAYTAPADMENRITVTIEGQDESFSVPPSDHFLNTIDFVCGLIRSGDWQREHQRARDVAELAGMFYDNCGEMKVLV